MTDAEAVLGKTFRDPRNGKNGFLGKHAMDRTSAYELMCQYTQNDNLRRHMLAVETAMRAYAAKNGEDIEKWGMAGIASRF